VRHVRDMGLYKMVLAANALLVSFAIAHHNHALMLTHVGALMLGHADVLDIC
jgi:hypothetical protein